MRPRSFLGIGLLLVVSGAILFIISYDVENNPLSDIFFSSFEDREKAKLTGLLFQIFGLADFATGLGLAIYGRTKKE